MAITIQSFFDSDTATFSYVVSDVDSKKAAVIDPVLNYDLSSGKCSYTSANEIIAFLTNHHLTLSWILETHIHADHMTAAHFLKEQCGGKIGIGVGILDVLAFWVPLLNTAKDTPLDGSQFDQLFHDGDVIPLGDTSLRILSTPGHTPSCVSYFIEKSLFVGDAILMPDIGTARTDFPSGSAETLFHSIHRIFNLPDDTEVFTAHDYPPQGREKTPSSSLATQKKDNVLINTNVLKEAYVQERNKRDVGKPVPKLLFPSLQVNLRAGKFGEPEENGVTYIKIPLNQF